jgi:hypothetical protein
VGLPKVSRRFVTEMLYGMMARGSVRLSEVARALDEPIPLKKTISRLSRQLGREGLGEALSDSTIRDGAPLIGEDTLLILDISEITKRYAKKMEYLALVRDGSDGGKLENGYWTCNVTGAEVGEAEITPLYHTLYSAEAPQFVSENRELLTAISFVSKHTGGRGIWVIDRGGDRGRLYNRLLDDEKRFIIRLRGDRNLLHRGREVLARELASSCSLPCADRVVKEEKGREKTYLIEYGFLKVRLPFRSEQLYMVVVKGFGQEPLMLLTNVPMRKRRSVLWRAVEAYLTRWRVEETIRFIKQSYDLEDVRVMTYNRLRNMAVLVLAAAYFTAVNLGLRAKLTVLLGHALHAARRIFGIPNFRYYALADGIKAILTRAGKGSKAIKQKPPPGAQLSLIGPEFLG